MIPELVDVISKSNSYIGLVVIQYMYHYYNRILFEEVALQTLLFAIVTIAPIFY